MLMPIGTFAKASRLSVKVLRNYDESGLLPATYVDPQTGYRYYRLEQLARADAIRSLRMVAMPLDQIVETLDGQDPELVLISHLETLEAKRDEIDQMAAQLRRRINTKEFVMSAEITLKYNPASTVAAYRTETTFSEIFNAIPTGFGAVIGALTEAGAASRRWNSLPKPQHRSSTRARTRTWASPMQRWLRGSRNVATPWWAPLGRCT